MINGTLEEMSCRSRKKKNSPQADQTNTSLLDCESEHESQLPSLPSLQQQRKTNENKTTWTIKLLYNCTYNINPIAKRPRGLASNSGPNIQPTNGVSITTSKKQGPIHKVLHNSKERYEEMSQSRKATPTSTKTTHHGNSRASVEELSQTKIVPPTSTELTHSGTFHEKADAEGLDDHVHEDVAEMDGHMQVDLGKSYNSDVDLLQQGNDRANVRNPKPSISRNMKSKSVTLDWSGPLNFDEKEDVLAIGNIYQPIFFIITIFILILIL
ncbi:hypothetical protein V2J09_004182 [Rumex salicifolius]